MKISKLLYSFCFFFISYFTIASSFDTLRLTKESNNIQIGQYVSQLVDSTGDLGIEIVRNSNFNQLQNNQGFNLGYSDAVHWFRVVIKNIDSCQLLYVYALNYAPINYVSFYDYSDQKLIKTVETGELKPFASRDILHRNFLLELTLKPGEVRTIYLRVNTQGDSAIIPLELTSMQSYFESEGIDLLVGSFVFGVFLLIIIFTLFYFITLRDIVITLFGLYVVLMLAALLYIDGFLKQLLLPNSEWFIDRLIYWLIPGEVFCLGLFSWYFLKLKSFLPRFKYWLMALMGIQMIGVLLSLLPYPIFSAGILIISVSAPLIIFFILFVSLWMLKHQYQPAIVLLISSLIPGGGIIIFFLRDYGFIPLNLFTEKIVKISYTLDVLILLGAIIYRVRELQRNAKEEIMQKGVELETQRQQLEATKNELKKLSISAKNTQNSIALFNRNGNLEWCNSGFLRLYGFPEDDLCPSINITTLYNNQIDSFLAIAQSKAESVQFECQLLNKDQRTIWVQTTLSPLFDDELLDYQFITIDSDITSLKLAQQELIMARDSAEEANRLKTAFLSNITHEIRTPLNSIIGFSQLLSIHEYSVDKQQKFLQMITTNGNHLLDIISDIIDISKIEAGRMELRPKMFPLNDMLQELVDQYTIQLQNKTLAFQAGIHERDVEILLELGLDDEAANIFTDQQRLKQVINNLLTNALKFTPSGSVTLGYNKRENEVSEELMFFIRDTGIGMSEDELRIIFQRFRQGNDAISQHYGGTGLGLSISKGLTDLMGGAIWMESKKNKGTTVYFSVPYIKAHTEMVCEQTIVHHRFDFSDKTILVVEDEYFNFNVVKEILEETRCAIVHAETGSQAFSIMESSQRIDLILMDIRLPDISGYEVTRKIRLKNKQVPVIAQTAYATDDVRYLCMKSGCNDYIAKPINPNYMLQLIAKYLNKNN